MVSIPRPTAFQRARISQTYDVSHGTREWTLQFRAEREKQSAGSVSITGGNLGLSPAAASFITGFSMIADSSNVFSTSASVVAPGKIYAADYATRRRRRT